MGTISYSRFRKYTRTASVLLSSFAASAAVSFKLKCADEKSSVKEIKMV